MKQFIPGKVYRYRDQPLVCEYRRNLREPSRVWFPLACGVSFTGGSWTWVSDYGCEGLYLVNSQMHPLSDDTGNRIKLAVRLNGGPVEYAPWMEEPEL